MYDILYNDNREIKGYLTYDGMFFLDEIEAKLYIENLEKLKDKFSIQYNRLVNKVEVIYIYNEEGYINIKDIKDIEDIEDVENVEDVDDIEISNEESYTI